MTRRAVFGAVGISIAVLLTGACTSEPSRPSLAGVWAPSDGTNLKRFGADGACSGVFYSNGKPLDIGGPMACQISEKEDADGRYTLFVSQGPNEATYFVQFDSGDEATVYGKSGKALYSMSKQ